jgi:hypothetical protein
MKPARCRLSLPQRSQRCSPRRTIGAAIGERSAREISGGNQVVGALVGTLALPLFRRLGALRLLALASRAYAMKYILQRSRKSTEATFGGLGVPSQVPISPGIPTD